VSNPRRARCRQGCTRHLSDFKGHASWELGRRHLRQVVTSLGTRIQSSMQSAHCSDDVLIDKIYRIVITCNCLQERSSFKILL
jgi:hypothetical protein